MSKFKKGLSNRELEIFSLLVKGLKGKAISKQLGLSEKTIGTYKTRIKEHLGIDRDLNDYLFVLKAKEILNWLNPVEKEDLELCRTFTFAQLESFQNKSGFVVSYGTNDKHQIDKCIIEYLHTDEFTFILEKRDSKFGMIFKLINIKIY